MRIQHKLICQPPCRISAVKVRGVREGKGGKKEGKRRKTEKNAKTGNRSNFNLKLSNLRYHRNCFRDFSSKLQINAAKSTCDQTSSDKAPVTAKLLKEILSILNSEQQYFLTILLAILFVHVVAKQTKYFPLNFNNYEFQFFIFHFQKNRFYA